MKPDDMIPLFTISGPVWAGMLQTSQAAEQTAAAAAPFHVQHPWHAYSDCKAVVQAASKTPIEQLDYHRMYAGYRRFSLLHVGEERHIEHVAAHRDWDTIVGLESTARTAAVGNYYADLAAKAAVRNSHTQPSGTMDSGLQLKVQQAMEVLKVVANVLPLFARERFERASADDGEVRRQQSEAASAKQKAVEPPAQHDWRQHADSDGWFCCRCLKVRPKDYESG